MFFGYGGQSPYPVIQNQLDILQLVSRKPVIESSFENHSLRPRAELCRRHLDIFIYFLFIYIHIYIFIYLYIYIYLFIFHIYIFIYLIIELVNCLSVYLLYGVSRRDRICQLMTHKADPNMLTCLFSFTPGEWQRVGRRGALAIAVPLQ